MPAQSEEPLKVVRSVTITVRAEWAAILTRLQQLKNEGRRYVLLDTETGQVGAVDWDEKLG